MREHVRVPVNGLFECSDNISELVYVAPIR